MKKAKSKTNNNHHRSYSNEFTDSSDIMIKSQNNDKWNLTNFNLLTDCVSSLADQIVTQEYLGHDSNNPIITTRSKCLYTKISLPRRLLPSSLTFGAWFWLCW